MTLLRFFAVQVSPHSSLSTALIDTGRYACRDYVSLLLACSLALTVPAAAQEPPLAGEAITSMSLRFLPGAETGPAAQAPTPDLFTGSLSTAIPIEFPPGRGGMTPPLQFGYRNTQRNSWTGIGWDLRSSSIERDTLHGLDFGGDGYDMDDGNSRTTLVSRGSGRYDPEIQHNFARIRRLPAESGRSYWEVTNKDGVVFEYGRTAEGRLDDPADANRIFSWYLEFVRDTHGNTITYIYDKVAAPAREIYLKSISYAASPGLRFPHTVYFIRELRPDVADSWATGFRVRISERLSAIDMLSLGVRQRRYQLRYTQSETNGASLLESVTPADRDLSHTLPPTTLDYASKAGPWTVANATGTGPDLSPTSVPIWRRCLTGDFNGDGRMDLACYSGSGGKWRVFPTTATGFGPEWGDGGINPGGADAGARCFAGDLDGDGHTDIACYTGGLGGPTAGQWSVQFSTGSGWRTGTFTGGPGVAIPIGNQCLSGDFDGDGRADITCYSGPGSGNWHTAFSNGTAFSPSHGGGAIDLPDARVTSRCVTGDFNGDGRTDFACYVGRDPNHSRGEWRVALSTGPAAGATWQAVTFAGQGPDITIPITDQCLTGDFNGDGKTDLACYSGPGTQGNWHVALSTGSGWAQAWGGGGPDASGGSHCLAADFDGDGKTDIACYDGFGFTNWLLAYATGSRWEKPQRPIFAGVQAFFGRARERCLVSDFHGYNKAAILCNGGTNWVTFSGPPGGNSFLTGVTSRSGGVTTIHYGSSLDSTDPRIGYVVPVVDSITTDDGRGTATSVATASFAYEGGYYNRPGREFRGFHHVKVLNPAGSGGERAIRDLWFHQGNDTAVDANDPAAPTGFTKGMVYRDRYSDQNRIRKFERTVALREDTGVSRFQPPVQVDELTCEGDSCAYTVRTQYAYDSFGNRTTTNYLGNLADNNDDFRSVIEYSPNQDLWITGLPTSITVFQGAKRIARSEFYYDGTDTCVQPSTAQVPARGDLTRVVRWLDGGSNPETLYAYSATGNLTCVRDANHNTTNFTYDPTDSFIARTEDPLHHVTTRTHFEPDHLNEGLYGELRTFTDANGNTLQESVDPFGRRKDIHLPDQRTITFTYEDEGDPKRQRVTAEAAGLMAASYYDGWGRLWLAKSTGPDGKTIDRQTEFDARGLLGGVSAPYFEGTQPPAFRRFSYDAMARMVSVRNGDNTTRSYCYSGWSGSGIDENGHAVRYSTDAFGNLVKVEEFDGVQDNCNLSQSASAQPYSGARYSYDPFGRLLSISGAGTSLTTLEYDTVGNLIRSSDPDRGSILYAHDTNGNVTQVTDAAGSKTFYRTDAINRITQIDFGVAKPDRTGDQVFIWDNDKTSQGRLSSAGTRDTNVTFAYDAAGRLLQRTYHVRGKDYPFTYSFDTAGRLASVRYPDQAVVSYEFNGPFLARVFDSQRDYARYSRLNEFGNPAAAVLGNGASLRWSYSRADNPECSANSFRLCVFEVRDAQGTVLRRKLYRYDPAGNVSAIQAPGARDEYTYDALDRLRTATHTPDGASPSTVRLEYDESGNLTLNSAIGAYTYGTTQPHAAKTAGPNRYTYDANGNIATSTHYKFKFDPLNRLVDVRQTDGSLLGRLHLQMNYAATGERVLTSDGSKWTVNLGDGYRCDSRGCARILYGSHGLIGAFSGTSTEYSASDHLGSTMAVLDAGGAATSRPDYQVWGAPPSGAATPSMSLPYRFNGKELDRSGLYYYGARYFDPVLGRFLSPDPLSGSLADPQSLNPYSYALNNPVTFVDRAGLKVMSDGDYGGGNREPAGRTDPELPHGINPDSRLPPGPAEPPEPMGPPAPREPPAPSPPNNNGSPAGGTPKGSPSSNPIHEPAARDRGSGSGADRREGFGFGGGGVTIEVPALHLGGTGEVLVLGGFNSGKGAFAGGIVAAGPEVDLGLVTAAHLKGWEAVKFLSGKRETETITLDEGAAKARAVTFGGGRYSTPKGSGGFVFGGKTFEFDSGILKVEFSGFAGGGLSTQAFESILDMLGISAGPGVPFDPLADCCNAPYFQGAPGPNR